MGQDSFCTATLEMSSVQGNTGSGIESRPCGLQMSNSSKQKVCFVMFVDQKSLDVILEEGQRPNDKGVLGLWKIVLIKNLPYEDGRRNGKVPKLLTHRLFPNARFEGWSPGVDAGARDAPK